MSAKDIDVESFSKMKETLKDRFNWAVAADGGGICVPVAADAAIAYADAALMEDEVRTRMLPQKGTDSSGWTSMAPRQGPELETSVQNREEIKTTLKEMESQLSILFNRFSTTDVLPSVENTVKVAAARNHIAKALLNL